MYEFIKFYVCNFLEYIGNIIYAYNLYGIMLLLLQSKLPKHTNKTLIVSIVL